MKTSFYALGMFPYPSGDAHLGHVRVYTITDVAARHGRLHGQHVLHPMGWDAFGLPAENAARDHGADPEVWTRDNIAKMRAQFEAMDWSFDWDREIDTSQPDYYRWTQWLFATLFERGLAYRDDGWVNHCPDCATVLADEQVTDGRCWRCDSAVDRRRMPQWFFRITAYAQRLWDGLDGLQGWSPEAVAVQRAWIGRSEGFTVRFDRPNGEPIEVFTTEEGAIGGAVAVVLAPEHPAVDDLAAESQVVRRYVIETRPRSTVERLKAPTRTGIATGAGVIHPSTGASIPVWIGDYVNGSCGTGAVVCAPAQDERDHDFASRMGLPGRPPAEIRDEGGQAAVAWNLRDWSVGRQRRWGCPIPIVHCKDCGPVVVPKSELPVLLGADPDCSCPQCGIPAKRERDTLDTFVCSAWYAFRFCDPHNDQAPFSREAVDRFMPIDHYVGGLEHAAQHMLYFRFITKVLFDLGKVGFDEPVDGFFGNGMVRLDGHKMSKSRRNVVSPAQMMARWGSDALRLAILADAPPERDVDWDESVVQAKHRFCDRWRCTLGGFSAAFPGSCGDPRVWPDAGLVRDVYGAMDGVDADIRSQRLHGAVARLHTLFNRLRTAIHEVDDRSEPERAALRTMVRDASIVMGVFAPGLADPIGGDTRWPTCAVAGVERVLLPVLVDGRKVGVVLVPSSADVAEVRALAEAEPAVQQRLRGRRIRRVVHVPGRVLNLVLAS